jgi:16S rRNA A1518/A1519 N6-dimethyltransferase RsmA/KsgA/DIM1 with predicted DNA glycosylase/AP lyase activity
MPYSYSLFKNEIRNHIVDNFPKETKILDVGAGSGTYGSMLNPHYKSIEAVEIFPNYIQMFNLEQIYEKVHIANVMEFPLFDYEYIIMGDILEHLSVHDAQTLLNKIHYDLKLKMLIAVPYQYEQGEEFGNVHETHHQPDLTVGIMYQRYPMLRLLYGDDKYGYYINYVPPIK